MNKMVLLYYIHSYDFQLGMYPQFESSDKIIESCSKCYVATMPCADLVTTKIESFFYQKTDTSDGYCEETKGKIN